MFERAVLVTWFVQLHFLMVDETHPLWWLGACVLGAECLQNCLGELDPVLWFDDTLQRFQLGCMVVGCLLEPRLSWLLLPSALTSIQPEPTDPSPTTAGWMCALHWGVCILGEFTLPWKVLFHLLALMWTFLFCGGVQLDAFSRVVTRTMIFYEMEYWPASAVAAFRTNNLPMATLTMLALVLFVLNDLYPR